MPPPGLALAKARDRVADYNPIPLTPKDFKLIGFRMPSSPFFHPRPRKTQSKSRRSAANIGQPRIPNLNESASSSEGIVFNVSPLQNRSLPNIDLVPIDLSNPLHFLPRSTATPKRDLSPQPWTHQSTESSHSGSTHATNSSAGSKNPTTSTTKSESTSVISSYKPTPQPSTAGPRIRGARSQC